MVLIAPLRGPRRDGGGSRGRTFTRRMSTTPDRLCHNARQGRNFQTLGRDEIYLSAPAPTWAASSYSQKHFINPASEAQEHSVQTTFFETDIFLTRLSYSHHQWYQQNGPISGQRDYLPGWQCPATHCRAQCQGAHCQRHCPEQVRPSFHTACH